MTPDPAGLWQWLPVGYVLTVAVEAPVLMAGLRWPRDAAAGRGGAATRVHPAVLAWRLMLAAWLTAVTYPVVIVALPLALPPDTPWVTYFTIAETFAIATECLVFRLACAGSPRDVSVIAAANLLSATVGLLVT